MYEVFIYFTKLGIIRDVGDAGNDCPAVELHRRIASSKLLFLIPWSLPHVHVLRASGDLNVDFFLNLDASYAMVRNISMLLIFDCTSLLLHAQQSDVALLGISLRSCYCRGAL
jgi:hypothetical protein